MDSVSTRPRRRFDAGGETLDDVGEAELLRRLTATALRGGGDPRLVVASGDDAAVWQPPAGAGIVLSQDAVVEGEDFLKAWTDPETVGRRAHAVGVSDLAAMGAWPRLCLVTLCAPGSAEVGDLMAIQEGVCAAAAETGCRVVGGDVSAIRGPLVIDVAVVGTVDAGRALRRDRGRPGDALVVTGSLGGAAAGLQILLDGVDARGEGVERWLDRQLRPRARLAEGQALAELGVECAGDLSDGLIVDVGRIIEASGCGAQLWLDRIPADPGIRTLLGDGWVKAALGGGEDFELVAAVDAYRLDGLLAAWPAGLEPLTVVGALDQGSGLRLLDRRGGAPVPLPAVASRHFRRP
ncbi:MAG: thiamine-phosphate kinase [Candidatus Dormibacteria bacterium]|jgi:thiamine-monophosphate kinase